MKQHQKLCTVKRAVIVRGQRTKALNELKPVKKKTKKQNPLSFNRQVMKSKSLLHKEVKPSQTNW